MGEESNLSIQAISEASKLLKPRPSVQTFHVSDIYENHLLGICIHTFTEVLRFLWGQNHTGSSSCTTNYPSTDFLSLQVSEEYLSAKRVQFYSLSFLIFTPWCFYLWGAENPCEVLPFNPFTLVRAGNLLVQAGNIMHYSNFQGFFCSLWLFSTVLLFLKTRKASWNFCTKFLAPLTTSKQGSYPWID